MIYNLKGVGSINLQAILFISEVIDFRYNVLLQNGEPISVNNNKNPREVVEKAWIDHMEHCYEE